MTLAFLLSSRGTLVAGCSEGMSLAIRGLQCMGKQRSEATARAFSADRAGKRVAREKCVLWNALLSTRLNIAPKVMENGGTDGKEEGTSNGNWDHIVGYNSESCIS